MDREQILTQYDVQNGIIRTPGKFEGEPTYAPYFWSDYLNGAWEEVGDLAIAPLEPADFSEFPEIPSRAEYVALEESSEGFVHVELLSEHEYQSLVDEEEAD